MTAGYCCVLSVAIPTDYTLGRGWLGRGRLGSLGLGRLDKLLAVSILAATRRGCTGSVRLRHSLAEMTKESAQLVVSIIQ